MSNKRTSAVYKRKDIASLLDWSSTRFRSSGTQVLAIPGQPELPIVDEIAELRSIAATVVDLVRHLGFDCAIFGSMACKLYGNNRLPEDIDVLILPPRHLGEVDQEWVKKQFVLKNHNFFMRRSKNPDASYMVLYYRISQFAVLPENFMRRQCKIDTLLPGIMDLPHLSPDQVIWRDNLPVLPFLVLLLQKLQGWDDHLNSPEPHKFRKHLVDAEDIKSLLKLAPDLPETMFQPGDEWQMLSQEFQDLSAARVKRFCRSFPAAASGWQSLGFQIT